MRSYAKALRASLLFTLKSKQTPRDAYFAQERIIETEHLHQAYQASQAHFLLRNIQSFDHITRLCLNQSNSKFIPL